MTRRVCIRCGTLQELEPGKKCGACGASLFSLVPVTPPETRDDASLKMAKLEDFLTRWGVTTS